MNREIRKNSSFSWYFAEATLQVTRIDVKLAFVHPSFAERERNLSKFEFVIIMLII